MRPEGPIGRMLAQGRIALQCEYAEVFYRDISIRPIGDGAFVINK